MKINTPKHPFSASRKPSTKSHRPPQAHKKRIRNSKVSAPSQRDVKNNLEHLAQILEVGKKVKNCEAVAAKLSALAGLNNGHVWSWNYIASVAARAMQPSKKFIRALALYLEHFNPRHKQWFYFSRRRSVAAVYDKSDLSEIIRSHFQQMGYRPVTHKRYMQIKKLGLHK